MDMGIPVRTFFFPLLLSEALEQAVPTKANPLNTARCFRPVVEWIDGVPLGMCLVRRVSI